jgi:hypothetical protein
MDKHHVAVVRVRSMFFQPGLLFLYPLALDPFLFDLFSLYFCQCLEMLDVFLLGWGVLR